MLETALLTALSEKQGHGYALFERVAELLGGQVNLDTGSLYRALRVLEDTGMVTSSWEIGPSGPPRRTYTVTPAGQALLGTHVQKVLEKAKQLELLAQAAREKLKSDQTTREPDAQDDHDEQDV
ncbi:MAG: PadR family transcriptional regulator [Thermoleophilia bacterium]|nr:PadR family transcriptional regulator [Thermoleophilia bacterium]